MKRDMNLIRLILFTLEDNNDDVTMSDKIVKTLEPQSYSQDKIYYHLELMRQAGLIELIPIHELPEYGSKAFAKKFQCDSPYVAKPTWAGHDFSDAIRNEHVWTETKKIISKIGENVSYEVLKLVIQQVAKTAINLL